MAYDGEIIREESFVTLSTLGNITAIKFDNPSITEDFRITKSEVICNVLGIDDSQDPSGLVLGLANNELSVAEIVECIRANGPLDRNDRVNHEEAFRWVKLLSTGVTESLGPGSGLTTVAAKFPNEHGGPIIEVVAPWTYSDPEGWCFFIYNNTGFAMTDGAQGRLLATHYGVWV